MRSGSTVSHGIHRPGPRLTPFANSPSGAVSFTSTRSGSGLLTVARISLPSPSIQSVSKSPPPSVCFDRLRRPFARRNDLSRKRQPLIAKATRFSSHSRLDTTVLETHGSSHPSTKTAQLLLGFADLRGNIELTLHHTRNEYTSATLERYFGNMGVEFDCISVSGTCLLRLGRSARRCRMFASVMPKEIGRSRTVGAGRVGAQVPFMPPPASPVTM